MIYSDQMDMHKIDETDVKIINAVLRNSRKSYRQIAKELNLSIATVINRLTRLEKEGIIKNYSAKVDYEKLGYDITAIIEIAVSKGKLPEVEEKLAKYSFVLGVYDITGESDAIIIARFKNRKDLNTFVKSLAMENVQRTNTHFVLNVVKEDFRMNIPK